MRAKSRSHTVPRRAALRRARCAPLTLVSPRMRRSRNAELARRSAEAGLELATLGAALSIPQVAPAVAYLEPNY